MKKMILMALIVLGFALNAVSAFRKAGNFSKGSMYVTAQAGLNSYAATADRHAKPFDPPPFPLGGSFEFSLTNNLGIGGTVMFDSWHDYLGMFGGKWVFRLFKPSWDITYHFRTERPGGLDFVAGANLGYSLLSVGNELGNHYEGNLNSEPHLALFLGTNLYFWEGLPGFMGRLMVTLKASWSVAGDFSGLYGSVGITYRIK